MVFDGEITSCESFMSNTAAFSAFSEARAHYCARRFDAALTAIERYRQTVDYSNFTTIDKRLQTLPTMSVVIVAYAAGGELIECLNSVLEQQGPRFEIILIDNGSNESIYSQLKEVQPLLWVKAPGNFLCSEGRNIGAHFAQSDIIIFLDDDAIMAPGYLAVVENKALQIEHLALRGRIFPKSSTDAHPPKHYDLGEIEQPGEFNLEGNMVIRHHLFQKIGGFDPLMFGHEGKALTRQWRRNFPEETIYYCPELIIHHNWARDEDLAKKRERQTLGIDYLEYLKEQSVNSGVSIILRAGDKLEDAQSFLTGLATYNTYKPIEVLLLSKDDRQAVAIAGSFMNTFFTRVLPCSVKTFSRVIQTSRYDNCLIVDMPTQIQADVIATWLMLKQADLKNVLFCSKLDFRKLTNTDTITPLAQLADQIVLNRSSEAILINNAHPKSITSQHNVVTKPTAKLPQTKKVGAKTVNADRHHQDAKITVEINQAEANIMQLKSQISQTDQTIAELEAKLLSLPKNNSDVPTIKNQLEGIVLSSCRLLIELKDAQDNLHELRIRSICKG